MYLWCPTQPAKVRGLDHTRGNQKGAQERSPTPMGMEPHASKAPLQHNSNRSHLTMIYNSSMCFHPNC